MKIVSPDTSGLAVAAEAIALGDVVAYPTETLYGLGADALAVDALLNLYDLKGRGPAKPVAVIIGDLGQLESLVESVPAWAEPYMKAFWPGPLSLLFPAKERLPRELCGPGEKVCVRLPASALARDLCLAFGGPITATSANVSGAEAACCLEDVQMEGIAVGIDGGRLEPSLPSTVLDPESGRILREGAVGSEAIETALKR